MSGKNRIRILMSFDNVRCPEQRKLEKPDLLQKLIKMVRIILYPLAISQSDCSRASPYQLSYQFKYASIMFTSRYTGFAWDLLSAF